MAIKQLVGLSPFLPSAAEMKQYDQRTIAAGTTSLTLMERVAEAVCKEISKRFSQHLDNVVILSGPGNNGADGYAIARKLLERSKTVQIIQIETDKPTPELLEQQARMQRVQSIRISPFSELSSSHQIARVALERASLVVDCLLGSGSRYPAQGLVASMLGLLASLRENKQSKAKLVALDIPSGVDPDNGSCSDNTIFADLTIAVELVKRGLLQSPAFERCGEICQISIGLDITPAPCYLLSEKSNLSPFPIRKRADNKGNFGSVLVVAGSASMPGAAYLASLAALRVGAGKVHATCSSFGSNFAAEIIQKPCYGSSGVFDLKALEQIVPELKNYQVCLIGPGLGQAVETQQAVLGLVHACREHGVKALIDADALNILSTVIAADAHDRVSLELSHCVLTPHPGEAARLLGNSANEIQIERYSCTEKLYALTKAVVVLKGAASIVFSGREGRVNLTGNAWMASAGSGDVLSGLVAGLIAQNLGLFEAASLGVYLHGRAADLVLLDRTAPIIASDLIAKIPTAISSYISDLS